MTANSPLKPDVPADKLAIERAERARRMGADGVPELIAMLGERNWMVRRRVIGELATLGDVALDALFTVLVEERGDETRNAAAMDAIAASTGDASARLLELTQHPVSAIAADAAQLLGRRRDVAALPRLARLATGDDDNVAVAAIEALGRIGGRGAVETLIVLVKSGNFFRTFPAIDVLGRSADPRAIAPLAALVQDSRYALEAMRALSRTADRTAVAPLASMLAHSSPSHVRVAASALTELAHAYAERYGTDYLISAALAQAAPPTALRSLAKALNGANSGEREAIARVLGMTQDPEAMPILSAMLDGPPALAKAGAQAMEALGPRVTSHLLELLRSGDSARRSAVLPLVSSNMQATDDVLRCLSDPDGNVRALAAEALSRTGASKAVAPLFALLEDPNARVVQAATAAIQALGGRETEALTLNAIRSTNPRVQREALRIVRAFGYVSAKSFALELAAHPDERLREAAIMAMSAIEDPRVAAALVERARDHDPKTRAMAARALGHAAPSAASRQVLLACTRDEDAWVRYYAAQALGRLGSVEALSDLTRLLRDPAAQVRISAVEALSHLGSDEAFAALQRAAESDEPDVRRAAVLGFGTLKRNDAVPILLRALDSADAATRLVATSALGNFEESLVVEAIGRAARDPDESVRSTALGHLAGMRSMDATLALIRLLPETRDLDRVLLALSAAFPGRITGLSSALSSADEETAATLASALARMRTHEAQVALIETLQSPNVAARKAAVTALSALGSEEAIEAVRAAARNDADPEVRKISALAIAAQ